MVKKSELNKRFYKTGEVAKMLNVSTRTIQNHAINGELPQILENHKKRIIPVEGLIEYLENKGLLINDTKKSTKFDVIYVRLKDLKAKEEKEDIIITRMLRNIHRNVKDLKVLTEKSSDEILFEILDYMQDDKINSIFLNVENSFEKLELILFKRLCKVCGINLIEI